MDFGAWEGLRWDAIAPADFAAWTADFAGHRCGGAESVRAFMERVGLAFADARAAGRDTLWITHGGVVRAATLLARGAPPPRQAADWPQAGLEFGAWMQLETVDSSG
jgi:alpha-ribazole phosphatase